MATKKSTSKKKKLDPRKTKKVAGGATLDKQLSAAKSSMNYSKKDLKLESQLDGAKSSMNYSK